MASSTTADLLPFTLIVIARNEAAQIGQCCTACLSPAVRIVVDSGSTDATVEIARQLGARVVHQDWLGSGPQRNFAAGLATYDWILMLDADQLLPPVRHSQPDEARETAQLAPDLQALYLARR